MQNTRLMQQEIDNLRGQNQQLNYKYKKALREILQVLKINKILKESNLQKQSQLIKSLNLQIQNLNKEYDLLKQMNSIQLKEMRADKQDRESRLKLLEPRLKLIEEQKDKYKADLALSLVKIKEFQAQEIQKKRQESSNSPKKLEILEQLTLIKKQNERLTKTLLRLQPLQQEKEQYIIQIQMLKSKIEGDSRNMSELQQKWQNQLSVLQNQYRKYQIDENAKLKQLERKCSVYEIELSNVKSIQKFIELESNQMLQEQNMFNTIRSQLEKVNDDFSKFQNQNNEYFNKIKQQEAEKIKIIAELQAQISKYKLQIEQNKKKSQNYQNQIQEKINAQKQINILQKEKKQLIQRLSVLQALTITQKHRNGVQVTEKIQQFQRKIHLLLQQNGQSITELGGFHQIIILKSYIRELSQLLINYKRREEKLIKKNQNLKIQLKEMENNFRIKIGEHKKKVSHYDSLVQRLYNLLEEKVAQKPVQQQKQKDINMALSKYEQKMMKMTDQIINLRTRKEQLEGDYRTKGDEQNQKLVATISKLQFNLSGLQAQNKSLMAENKMLLAENKSLSETITEQTNEAKQIILNKDNIITALTNQVQFLTEEKKSIEEKQVQFLSVKYSYQKEINRLHDALKLKSSKELPMSNKGNNNNEALIMQISQLQNQLKQTKQQIKGPQQSLKKIVKNMQQSAYVQAEQIQSYKKQNYRVYHELQNLQLEKQKQLAQKEILIIQLKDKIYSLQKQIGHLKVKLTQTNSYNQNLSKLNKDLVLKQKQAIEKLANRKGEELSKNQLLLDYSTQQRQSSNAQLITRHSKQVNDFNATILALRTENLFLKNELEEKDFSINELKHQIYNSELKFQKQKSRQKLLTIKQTIPQQSNEHLLILIVLLSAQIQALQNKMMELQNNPNAFIKNSIIYESELIQMPQNLEISNEVQRQGPMTPKQIKSRIMPNSSTNIVVTSQSSDKNLMKLSSQLITKSRENIETQVIPDKIESFSQKNIQQGSLSGKAPVKGNARSQISISNSLTMENLQNNSISQSFSDLDNSKKFIVTQLVGQQYQLKQKQNEPIKSPQFQYLPIDDNSKGFVKLIKQSSQSINVEDSPLINPGVISPKIG